MQCRRRGQEVEDLWMWMYVSGGDIIDTSVLPWSALGPHCLLSLKRARRLPTAACKVTCFDPAAKRD